MKDAGRNYVLENNNRVDSHLAVHRTSRRISNKIKEQNMLVLLATIGTAEVLMAGILGLMLDASHWPWFMLGGLAIFIAQVLFACITTRNKKEK